MRRAAPLLLLAAFAAAADLATDTFVIDDPDHRITVADSNGTVVLRDNNGTTVELDADGAEIVRKKRTFGDVVFRGIADVLGYNVARKPPQAFDFPPPVAPVPGIDTPLAAAAPAPAPCAQPRAAPPPCRAPPPAPPCGRPRAAPRARPKPRPAPPPPPPPPCAQPRANPATPAPCAPPPPPPKLQADTNLERITSNLRLNFNFNRSPVTPAAAPAAGALAEERVETPEDDADRILPIVIQPQAAKLPVEEPQKPRVYVDAFVVQNGIAKRVDTVDAKRLSDARDAGDDYLAYDDESAQQQLDDDYEDVQESRDRDAAVRQFGHAVGRFWDQKQQYDKPYTRQKAQPRPAAQLPVNHYQNVHFGDRQLANNAYSSGESHQSLQRESLPTHRIPLLLPDAEDDSEVTTTTEDPKKKLRPRILPPTEHNPNQIDTVTVRVPPIYREKRPKKLHRDRPDPPDRDDEDEEHQVSDSYSRERGDEDSYGYDSPFAQLTEQPRRKRRRKQNRKTRSVEKSNEESEKDKYSLAYDYFGNKVPISAEEKFYMELTVPTPTVDADVARHESPVKSGYFLDDHERLREDPKHRIQDNDDKSDESEDIDESERSSSSERAGSSERSSDDERAGSLERTDKLSPNARVRESAYQNKYIEASDVQVDEPNSDAAIVKRRTVKVGQKNA